MKEENSRVSPELEVLQKLTYALEYWEKVEAFCRSQVELEVPGAEWLMQVMEIMESSLRFTVRGVLENLEGRGFGEDIGS